MTAVDAHPSVARKSAPPRRPARQAVSGYVALTKPRIIELLLVTTVPTMFLAEGGVPSLWLVAATLVGGSMAAGSANTLNCFLDRDIDMVMHRTERRPLATGLVSPREALVFGVLLGAASVVWLGVTVGWLAAALAFAAIAFYVLVYTMALKRRTPQNIVWGGAAGCMPVLIGWSAVTGSLSWTPVVLFGVIFFWTPPHYWPLSLRFRDDYAAAGVPMLPVVAGARETKRQMLLYTLMLWPVVLAPWFLGFAGPCYAIGAGALSLLFTAAAIRVWREPSDADQRSARRMFAFSLLYLFLIFTFLLVDRIGGGPW